MFLEGRSRSEESNPPILSSPSFALHQPKANQLAAQRCRVLMIAFQDLIHLLFAITLFDLKRLDHIPQDRPPRSWSSVNTQSRDM